MKRAFAFAILLATGLCVSAKPTTFKNSGLKTETVITLDVKGKRITGTFESSEYGENAVTETFTGKVGAWKRYHSLNSASCACISITLPA